jgi:hypothetical protein
MTSLFRPTASFSPLRAVTRPRVCGTFRAVRRRFASMMPARSRRWLLRPTAAVSLPPRMSAPSGSGQCRAVVSCFGSATPRVAWCKPCRSARTESSSRPATGAARSAPGSCVRRSKALGSTIPTMSRHSPSAPTRASSRRPRTTTSFACGTRSIRARSPKSSALRPSGWCSPMTACTCSWSRRRVVWRSCRSARCCRPVSWWTGRAARRS